MQSDHDKTASAAPAVTVGSTEHHDVIEKLTSPFYIRWTSGPNYERAFLCVEDGEPDMNDFAEVSFGRAAIFKAALSARCSVTVAYAPPSELAELRAERDAYIEACNVYEADLKVASARLTQAVEALEPFSDMAGEMFSRGWDATNVALALDNPGDSHRVTAGDFFRARTTQGRRVMREPVKPERAHTLVVSMGADTALDLAWGLRHMADDIERGQLTVGASGSPSVGSTYSYRIRPEQTHDVYFRQLNDWLDAEAGRTALNGGHDE